MFAGNITVSVLRFKIEIYSSHINLRAREYFFIQIEDKLLNFKSLSGGLMLLEGRRNSHFTRGLKRVPWDTVGKETEKDEQSNDEQSNDEVRRIRK